MKLNKIFTIYIIMILLVGGVVFGGDEGRISGQVEINSINDLVGWEQVGTQDSSLFKTPSEWSWAGRQYQYEVKVQDNQVLVKEVGYYVGTLEGSRIEDVQNKPWKVLAIDKLGWNDEPVKLDQLNNQNSVFETYILKSNVDVRPIIPRKTTSVQPKSSESVNNARSTLKAVEEEVVVVSKSTNRKFKKIKAEGRLKWVELNANNEVLTRESGDDIILTLGMVRKALGDSYSIEPRRSDEFFVSDDAPELGAGGDKRRVSEVIETAVKFKDENIEPEESISPVKSYVLLDELSDDFDIGSIRTLVEVVDKQTAINSAQISAPKLTDKDLVKSITLSNDDAIAHIFESEINSRQSSATSSLLASGSSANDRAKAVKTLQTLGVGGNGLQNIVQHYDGASTSLKRDLLLSLSNAKFEDEQFGTQAKKLLTEGMSSTNPNIREASQSAGLNSKDANLRQNAWQQGLTNNKDKIVGLALESNQQSSLDTALSYSLSASASEVDKNKVLAEIKTNPERFASKKSFDSVTAYLNSPQTKDETNTLAVFGKLAKAYVLANSDESNTRLSAAQTALGGFTKDASSKDNPEKVNSLLESLSELGTGSNSDLQKFASAVLSGTGMGLTATDPITIDQANKILEGVADGKIKGIDGAKVSTGAGSLSKKFNAYGIIADERSVAQLSSGLTSDNAKLAAKNLGKIASSSGKGNADAKTAVDKLWDNSENGESEFGLAIVASGAVLENTQDEDLRTKQLENLNGVLVEYVEGAPEIDTAINLLATNIKDESELANSLFFASSDEISGNLLLTKMAELGNLPEGLDTVAKLKKLAKDNDVELSDADANKILNADKKAKETNQKAKSQKPKPKQKPKPRTELFEDSASVTLGKLGSAFKNRFLNAFTSLPVSCGGAGAAVDKDGNDIPTPKGQFDGVNAGTCVTDMMNQYLGFFFSGYENYKGIGKLASLFMDEEDLAERRDKVNQQFCDTVILGGQSCWVSEICETYPDNSPDNGVLVMATPGGGLSTVAHIEAKKIEMSFQNNSQLQKEYVYKITYAINNPHSQSMYYNVVFMGDKTNSLFVDDLSGAPANKMIQEQSSDSKMGSGALLKTSKNNYNRVCLQFAPKVQSHAGDQISQVCNVIVFDPTERVVKGFVQSKSQSSAGAGGLGGGLAGQIVENSNL